MKKKEFKKVYVVYKTTNKVNKKIYVGVHGTFDLDKDCYYGSGNYLLSSINKYGKINFEREILYIYHSEKVAYEREKYIVNKEFLEREDTMNLKLGGYGGWTKECRRKAWVTRRKNGNIPNGEYINTLEASLKRRKTNKLKYGSEAGIWGSKLGIEKSLITRYRNLGNVMAQCHTIEAKAKERLTKIRKYGNPLGTLNSKEAQRKRNKTFIEKYNDPMGKANTSLAKEKRLDTFRNKSITLYPELNSIYSLTLEDELIYSGTLLNLSSFMHGQSFAVSKHSRLILINEKEKIINRGKYKGHKLTKIILNGG